MTKHVGLFEAKTHLSELVAAAEKGETIVVTRKGRPVAEIKPIGSDRSAVRQAIERMRRHGQEIRLRNGGNVSSEDVLAWTREGRRYE